VRVLAGADEEVIGFDVPVQDVFLMQQLNAVHHLFAHLQHCFEGETFSAIVEQIFQTLSEQVHEHDVVLAFGGEGVDLDGGGGTLGMPATGPKEERYLYILA
jgi:hypothetical protein